MQSISIATGEKTVIKLPDLSTAGYSWEIVGDFEKIISVEKMAKELPANSKIVGGKDEVSFEITGLQKGIVTIQFQQKRSWEKDAGAAKTLEYAIAVI